jgi:hypothetical protein
LKSRLRVFAIRGGVVPFNDAHLDQAARNNLKQSVSLLGKRLITLFHIEGKPFKDAGKSRQYEAHFRISTVEGVKFPTPSDATWDMVSITEVRAGVVAVSVDAVEDFAVYTPDDDGERLDGRWEAAEQIGTRQRQYDLPTLGLVGDNGLVNATGEALLQVLRSAGKLRRKERDPAMLVLGQILSNLMQIDKPPFHFSSSQQTWSAHFDASSMVGGESR